VIFSCRRPSVAADARCQPSRNHPTTIDLDGKLGRIAILSTLRPGWHGNTLLVLGGAHELHVADAERGCQLVEAHDSRIVPALLRPLMYCWLNPESSASCSWVKPFSCLTRLTFRPTSLRISMRAR